MTLPPLGPQGEAVAIAVGVSCSLALALVVVAAILSRVELP